VRQPLRIAAALAAGAALCGAAAAADAPQTPAQTWWAGYLANAQLVNLPDGRRMHLYCEGQGAPVVVLDAGLGDGAWSWSHVQGQMAAKTRVCSFDRAGYGKSSPGPRPRDTKAIVADEVAMLKAAHEPGPYVLVGHSLASFDVRLFALTYPMDVAGVVLVDPSADYQMKRMAEAAPKVAALSQASSGALQPCAERPRPREREKVCVGILPPGTPPGAVDYLTQVRGPDYFRAMLDELEVFADTDSAELAAARETLTAKARTTKAGGGKPLGAKPLIILTAASMASPGLQPEESAAVYKVWVTLHDEMATLSSRGVNRTVEGAGHGIQREKPQVVIDAVAEVVDAVRAGRR
jgi:pimeloyl-ACP methyl ester carboxylesterase